MRKVAILQQLLLNASLASIRTSRATIAETMKTYNQYCPIAHALDVVGERWSLLIIRELVEHDQLRYSDLHANLPGCGTNILAARLKELERHGVVRRRRLPPPAASTVYELTEYGQELRPVLHMLAHWGARSLGPPDADTPLEPGWLAGALEMIFFEPRPTRASSSASTTRWRRSSTGSRARGRSRARTPSSPRPRRLLPPDRRPRLQVRHRQGEAGPRARARRVAAVLETLAAPAT